MKSIRPIKLVVCWLVAVIIPCRPEDYQEAINRDREGYFFIDVQARGKYPNYALKKFEREGLTIKITPEDEAILAASPVDFVSFLITVLERSVPRRLCASDREPLSIN